ncbi:MAG TPA: HAMP domain-containing sensor histidine kinase [Thermoanaerobaculia bacterium]|jgi:signal transduction histidine kinase|nr:HAMP domain-containing sensor histidine kinase [Thermoanaerobaculia bacterium]
MKMRVPLAALVLLLGVGGLLAAWYVSSRRALDAEVRLQSQMATRATLENERTVADRLARRLEELRTSESQRPYFHYQNLYHDPKGASQGLSVVPSPLANGSENPLVTAHFQIDANGRVSLPTLNEELRELNAPDAPDQRAIRDTLTSSAPTIRESVASLVAVLDREAEVERAMNARIAELETSLAEARQREARLEAARAADARGVEARLAEARVAAQRNLAGQQSSVQLMDPQVFDQNARSNTVYQQLKQRVAPAPVPVEPRPAPPVEIRTTPLEWRTLTIAGKPTLVALRAVHTPEGPLVQGLLTPVVDGNTIEGAVVHRAPAGTSIEGTGWRAQFSGPAATQQDAERERFMRTFTAVAGVLLLVVMGVIWTLSRVERLATDRARFAATAAHELRTPLASLRVYSDLIAEEVDSEKRERYAREIAGQTERLGRVVANVLEVTRLERGTFALAPRPGEIGRAVADCIARLEPQMQAAQCPIDLRVAPDLPEIAFDPDALHHVVDNLVDNAEKFSRDVPDRSISVDVAPDEGGVRITVSDRGPGVPEALFVDAKPFRRGTTAMAPSGLGLGLFLVDRIVRGHGGAIRSSPRDGGGASVSVFLPAFYRP